MAIHHAHGSPEQREARTRQRAAEVRSGCQSDRATGRRTTPRRTGLAGIAAWLAVLVMALSSASALAQAITLTPDPTPFELEPGGVASYSVVLDTEPANNVTVTPVVTPLSSNRRLIVYESENGNSSLVFTPDNYNTVQWIEIEDRSGVKHTADWTATVNNTVTGDSAYETAYPNASDLAVTVTIKESFILSIANASASESAEEIVFTVSFNRAPISGDLEIPVGIALPGTGVGYASAADFENTWVSNTITLAITTNTLTTYITVPIINDSTQEGDETFQVHLYGTHVLSFANRGDANYNDPSNTNHVPTIYHDGATSGEPVRDYTRGTSTGGNDALRISLFATGTIEDDEASVVVTADDPVGFVIGNRTTYTVQLRGSAPTDPVTITPSLQMGSRLQVDDGRSTPRLVFDATNHDDAQTFYIGLAQGSPRKRTDEIEVISHTVTGDAAYRNAPAPQVRVNVEASPLLSISDATAEEDGDMLFTVSLNKPIGSDLVLNVGIALGSGTDAAVREDFDTPFLSNTVTVPGGPTDSLQAIITVAIKDDNVPEDDETFQIHIYGGNIASFTESTDPNYTTSRPFVHYDGAAAAGEQIPAPGGDGQSLYGTGTIVNDDIPPGVVIGGEALAANGRLDAGLWGSEAEYTVQLEGPAPTAAVTVVPSATGDGVIAFNPATLTFTTDGHTNAKTVTITKDRKTASDSDGAELLTITHAVSSTDAKFDAVTSDAVTVAYAMDDIVSIASAMAQENDREMLFTVRLNQAAPSGGVNFKVGIALQPNQAVAADFRDSYVAQAVTIPEGATEAVVTVLIEDDANIEGDETFRVHLYGGDHHLYQNPGADGHATERPVIYNDGGDSGGMVPITTASGVTVDAGESTFATGTITDNDVAGITFTPAAFNMHENADHEYAVVLDAAPTGSVTVAVSAPAGLAAAPPSPLTFTTVAGVPGGWDTAQTVTIAADDDTDTADDTHTIAHAVTSATDTNYPALTDANVVVTVFDDDAGVIISRNALRVVEGSVGSYAVQLRSRPSAAVLVSLILAAPGDNPASATVSPTSLEFTPMNWDQPRSVQITASPDDADDDDETLTITHRATSTDAQYNGDRVIFTYRDDSGADTDDTALTATLVDDDVPGVIVSTAALRLPPGGSPTYTVHLAGPEAPTANVTITASAPANGPVLVHSAADTAPLVFTPSNHDTPQTLTVSGRDGVRPAANVDVTITHQVSSDDAAYGNISVADVAVTVQGHVLLDIADATADEGDGEMVFTASLNRAHTQDIAFGVGIVLGGEGGGAAAAPASAADFTASFVAATARISAGQTQTLITVPITDDDLPEGNETFQLHLYGEDVQAHSDPGADNLTTSRPLVRNASAPSGQRIRNLGTDFPSTVSLYATGTIADDERSAFVSSTTLSLAPGEAPSYAVRLRGPAPTANVTVTAATPEDSPVVARSATGTTFLVFTPSNYDTEQTLTVSGKTGVRPVADAAVTITHEASGNDADYAAVLVPDVTVLVLRHLVLTMADAVAGELDGEVVFTARLSKALAEDVTLGVGIVLQDASGGAAASAADFSASFVAAAATIAAGQTRTLVTVPIIDDGADEANETFQLHLYGEDVQRLADPSAEKRTTSRPTVRNADAPSGQRVPNLSAAHGETVTLYAAGTIVDGTLPVVAVPGEALNIIPNADDGSYQAVRFTVSINTQPDAELTLTPTPPQSSGLTVTPNALVFTRAGFRTVHTVTVSAAGDEDIDDVDNTVAIGWTKTGGGDNYAPIVIADTEVVIREPGSPAWVTGVTVESRPGDADKGYVVGEAVMVKVSFSWPIPVTDRPRLRLRIGGVVNSADLSGGVGAGEVPSEAVDSLTFAYAIQAGDVGADGVETASDDLFRGGGAALRAVEVPGEFLGLALPDTTPASLFVDAGDDQEVGEQEAVALKGSGSASGGRTLAYRWTQHEDNEITVELEDADEATATFTTPNLAGPVALTFILEATAGDDEERDEVVVTIDASDEPPTATASANPTTVNAGETVTLTGTGSDPEGEDVTYAWSIEDGAGQTFAIDDPDSATTTFTAPVGLAQDATLKLRLEVSDGVNKTHAIAQVAVRAADLSEVLGESLSRMGRLMAMSARDAVGARVGAGAASAKRARRGLTLNGSRIDTAMSAWLRNVTPLSIQGSAQGGLGPAGPVPGSVPWSTTTAYRGAAGDACGGGHARPVFADCNHFAERVLAGGPTLPPALTPWNRYSNITSFEYALGMGESESDESKAKKPKRDKSKADKPKEDKPKVRKLRARKPKPDKPKPDRSKPRKPKGDGPSGLLSDTSLWGQFDARAFASEPTTSLDLEGSMTAFHVGIDKLYNGRDAVGIALGLPSNTVDFTRDKVTGEVSLSMVNFHPYASWSPRNGLFNVWGMLGFGSGESEVTVKSQEPQAADTSMAMFAGGGRMPLVKVGIRDFGDIHVAVKADAFSVGMSSDKAGTLAEQSVSASQLRAVLEGRMTYAMSDSTFFEPVLEFGVRTDGGDGDTGMGMEMGLGATYTNTAMGLSADGRGRFLVAHGDDGVAEAGYSLLLLYNPGGGGGLGLTLAPVWGETASQADALWHAQDLSRFTLHHAPGSHGLSGRGAARGWRPDRMDVSLHYGIERAHWLVTPYGSLVTGGAGDDRERVRLGARVESLNLASGTAHLNLFNESSKGPGLEASLRLLLH